MLDSIRVKLMRKKPSFSDLAKKDKDKNVEVFIRHIAKEAFRDQRKMLKLAKNK